jgi:hypothetical protein
MKKYLIFFILFFINLFLYPQEKTNDYIEKRSENIWINWTKGIIYSQYTSIDNKIDKGQLEKITFENVYHNLILNLLEIYLESGITLKEALKNDVEMQKQFHQIKEKIQIEKKIVYLNKITYLVSFNFLKYFNKNINFKLEDSIEPNPLPIKKEKDFSGIIIYVPTKNFQPSIRLKLYSNNGKMILYFPVKENCYFSNDDFLYKNPKINQPYVIYTEKVIHSNDIIIDQKDIEFLLATKKIFDPDSIKVILYDQTK